MLHKVAPRCDIHERFASVAERAVQNQQFQFGLKIRIFSFLDLSGRPFQIFFLTKSPCSIGSKFEFFLIFYQIRNLCFRRLFKSFNFSRIFQLEFFPNIQFTKELSDLSNFT
ncbi:hypothetical protein C7S20_12635 [Christiangramia fulva]|uniref:Uncharacterized protein n=1 Tax=Christiangramia fulva TaxID=2126553 RepID=A0A2R3Z755_9FLAO|nr:hypothetical protein C7S20_12635 [Christiangramia fulva]